jgi:L-lactate dehydrogenase complex protein LldG
MVAASNSRQTILDRLRTIPIEAAEVQPIERERLVHYDDPIAKFTEILSHVGGAVHLIDDVSQVGDILRGFPQFSAARHVVSLVPEAVVGNFHCEQVEDPHSLAALDWATVRGEFPVAENGAIWVRPAGLTQRAMLFITQHLAIVVSRSAMVMHMHEAYDRIRSAGQYGLAGPEFGVFISGPSKTADIEQSLVIGAHGCRTLQVFLTP